MKRLYAAAAIIALLGGLCWYSVRLMRDTAGLLEVQLTRTELLADSGRDTAAARAAGDMLRIYRQREQRLRFFIRRDLLTQLEETLAAISASSEPGQSAQLRIETNRARCQVRALSESFFLFF